MRNWRAGSKRTLNTRPIYENEFPILVQSMVEEGLIASITYEGIRWSILGYPLKTSAVCKVWSLSPNQYRRLCDYILINDPFFNLYKDEITKNGEKKSEDI
tara:strand:+ start:1750 stop:2052 length:303 start_codon:yes stop_codon:yes gene_type:complete